MGLYITSKIIGSLGGEIKVQSRPQEGSAFEVFLNRHILKNGDNLESLKISRPLDTISAVKDLGQPEVMPKPDLIICDIMMDRMDGYAFYETISARPELENIPFLFLTAKTGPEEKLKAFSKGVLDYIQKPFLLEELVFKVEKCGVQNRVELAGLFLGEKI